MLEARNKDGGKRADGVCLLFWPLNAGLRSYDSGVLGKASQLLEEGE